VRCLCVVLEYLFLRLPNMSWYSAMCNRRTIRTT